MNMMYRNVALVGKTSLEIINQRRNTGWPVSAWPVNAGLNLCGRGQL